MIRIQSSELAARTSLDVGRDPRGSDGERAPLVPRAARNTQQGSSAGRDDCAGAPFPTPGRAAWSRLLTLDDWGEQSRGVVTPAPSARGDRRATEPAQPLDPVPTEGAQMYASYLQVQFNSGKK